MTLAASFDACGAKRRSPSNQCYLVYVANACANGPSLRDPVQHINAKVNMLSLFCQIVSIHANGTILRFEASS
jgi:hypothetical protein